MVLRRVMINAREARVGAFRPNWKGSYKVTGILHLGAYKLKDMDGVLLLHLWNVEHLRIYYQ